MHKSWFVTVAVAATAALFMAPSTPQKPVPQRMANAYADWLVPYIGKAFYLSPDWAVATEKTRTFAVPVGAGEFTLAAVGQDFVYFEDKSDRVCVPLVALRAVLQK